MVQSVWGKKKLKCPSLESDSHIQMETDRFLH